MVQWINDQLISVEAPVGSLVPDGWVKDLVLLQLWCRLQLQFGFDP